MGSNLWNARLGHPGGEGARACGWGRGRAGGDVPGLERWKCLDLDPAPFLLGILGDLGGEKLILSGFLNPEVDFSIRKSIFDPKRIEQIDFL